MCQTYIGYSNKRFSVSKKNKQTRVHLPNPTEFINVFLVIVMRVVNK